LCLSNKTSILEKNAKTIEESSRITPGIHHQVSDRVKENDVYPDPFNPDNASSYKQQTTCRTRR
jgi:hypothetical protein